MNQELDNSNKAKTVIFLHLPKAAGTTLCDIFLRQYQAGSIHLLDGTNFDQAQEDFKQLSPEEKAQIKILMGHMYFGLHEYQPHPATYVTMLRNPIDRVISYYYFIKKARNHPDYEMMKTKNISIEDYCQMGVVNMCNGQTRFLSGNQESEINGKEILKQAKKNLQEYFSVVGIQEKFDESLLMLRNKLAWKKMPYYYRRNTNRTKSYRQEISNSTRAAIEKYNELDLELYEYATKIFEQKLKQQNGKIERKLQLFKLKNQVYGKYSAFVQKAMFK
ncbi:MAG: sulfotransferase family 2 domain-containing protein [Cyanobacteria bacterium P01_G01_bin.67]